MVGAITIVSGLPRSGTSLMMQMLRAGGMPLLVDDVRAPDVDNPHGYFEFEPVKRAAQNTSWLAAAEDKAVKIILHLLFHLPADRHYRVLFLRRPLSEVVASQRAMLERQGKSGAKLPDAKLIEMFSQELDKLAGWLSTHSNASLLEVDFPALLATPLRSAKRIDRFLGGGLDLAAMTAAVKPSIGSRNALHCEIEGEIATLYDVALEHPLQPLRP